MTRLLNRYLQSYAGLSRESWMLSVVMLINRSGAMVIPFLGIYLHQELGFSIADAGFCLSFYGIGSLLGSFIGGYLTDKIGYFKVQVISLIFCMPLYLLIPNFASFWIICALLFLLGVVSEIFRPANSVAITKFAKRENITKAFSLNRMAVNLGFSIGPAIGGVLAAYSFHLLFYVNTVTCAIAMLVFVFFFRNRKERNEVKEYTSENATNTHARSPYRDMKFLWFTLFCTFFAIAFFQLLSTLPLFLKDEVGYTQEEVGLILGYSGFIIVLMEMPLISFVERRFSILQIMVWGTVITGVNYFLYTIDYSFAIIFLAITFMSIGEMLVLPFMSTITALRSGDHNKGAYMGVNGVSVGIALIISPVLGTAIAESYGFKALWWCTALLVIVSAIGFYYTISPMKEVEENEKKR